MSLILPDGRTLDFREFGDPDGLPVVNNHGGLVCGMDIAAAHVVAQKLGLRIISPDRPGVGSSSPLPQRRPADWATDVRALLDHLGLVSCSAFGWSLGSEYALALGASGIADQLVVVGAVPPLTAAGLARLNRTDRTLAGLSQGQPAVARTVFAGMRALAPMVHAAAGRMAGSEDADIIAGLTDFPTWIRHALRQPDGMVEEYRAMCGPWGFAPSEVTCPVHMWHGTQDGYVPLDLAHELEVMLPDAQFEQVTGAGHFLAYRRWEQVLAPFAP